MDRLIQHRHIYQLAWKNHQAMKFCRIVHSTYPAPFVVTDNAVHFRAPIDFLKDTATLWTSVYVVHALADPFVHWHFFALYGTVVGLLTFFAIDFFAFFTFESFSFVFLEIYWIFTIYRWTENQVFVSHHCLILLKFLKFLILIFR